MLSLAMADPKPLETSGWGHWFMLITLLLFLFSFIVKIVLRVKNRTNNLPWVKSVGGFWFLASTGELCVWGAGVGGESDNRAWGLASSISDLSSLRPRNSAISPSLTFLGGVPSLPFNSPTPMEVVIGLTLVCCFLCESYPMYFMFNFCISKVAIKVTYCLGFVLVS